MSSATLPQVAWAGSLVASGLLAVSGALKVRNPDSVVPLLAALHVPRLLQRGRVVGIAELALGAGAGVSSYRLALATEGAVYVSFALVIGYVLVARVPLASCGCSGRQQTPPSVLHVGLNLAAASAAFIGASVATPALSAVWPQLNFYGAPVAIAAGAAVALALVVMGPLVELLHACLRVRAAELVYQSTPRSEAVE